MSSTIKCPNPNCAHGYDMSVSTNTFTHPTCPTCKGLGTIPEPVLEKGVKIINPNVPCSYCGGNHGIGECAAFMTRKKVISLQSDDADGLRGGLKSALIRCVKKVRFLTQYCGMIVQYVRISQNPPIRKINYDRTSDSSH